MNSCKICCGSYFVWVLQVCTIVSTQPEIVMLLNDKGKKISRISIILQLHDKSISAMETYTTNVFHSQLGDRRTKSKYFSSSHD